MEHVFFCDGNPRRISWVIQTQNNTVEQQRDHADIYLDKVTTEQSKYIALHVGIFWCIGRFIIKNDDIAKVMLDSKTMYEHLSGSKQSPDPFIKNRTKFLNQLIGQRRLEIKYHLIESNQNIASKLL